MTSHYTHRILDEAGVDAVLDAAERYALQNGHRVVIAVPLEEVPDPTFGHVQSFDLPSLARIAGIVAPRWSAAVHAADGGWLVLDRRARHTARSGRQPLS